jgi:hypothetical protein
LADSGAKHWRLLTDWSYRTVNDWTRWCGDCRLQRLIRQTAHWRRLISQVDPQRLNRRCTGRKRLVLAILLRRRDV